MAAQKPAGATAAPHGGVSARVRGREGERKTAEVLGGLPQSWTCLHGRLVGGGRADIDHAVIGPHGVFVVDSKNLRRCWRYGQALWSGAGRLDLEPTRYGADDLQRVLGVPVTPVVCLVNQEHSGVLRDLWVVGLHDLVDRLTSEPARHQPEIIDALVTVTRRRFPPAGWSWRLVEGGRWRLLDRDRRVVATWNRRQQLQVKDERHRADAEVFARCKFGEQGRLPLT